jgi:hypothetical protein
LKLFIGLMGHIWCLAFPVGAVLPSPLLSLFLSVSEANGWRFLYYQNWLAVGSYQSVKFCGLFCGDDNVLFVIGSCFPPSEKTN